MRKLYYKSLRLCHRELTLPILLTIVIVRTQQSPSSLKSQGVKFRLNSLPLQRSHSLDVTAITALQSAVCTQVMRSNKPWDRPKFAAVSKRLIQAAASSSEAPELDPAAAEAPAPAVQMHASAVDHTLAPSAKPSAPRYVRPVVYIVLTSM